MNRMISMAAGLVLSGFVAIPSTDAAIDQHVYVGGGVWQTNSVLPTNASALATNSGQADNFFAAVPGIGVQNIVSGIATTISNVGYTSLSMDRVTTNRVYGSRPGQAEMIEYAGGGVWNTTPIGTTHYKAMASTATAGTELIVAKADGSGTDYTWYAGGGSWGSANINAVDYNAIATDPALRYDFYGAKSSGGLDHVYYGGGVWNVSPINNNTYVALASDVSTGYNLFGARADGGVDYIYYSGGWHTDSISADAHTALAADGSGTYRFFAAEVPEPASLSLLALGALIVLRRRT